MKKKLTRVWSSGQFVLLALFTTLFLSACDDINCIKGEGPRETRTLNLQQFKSIEANGSFKVYITQGATQQVEVKGESNILDQLNTSISNNTWKIEHTSCVRRSNDVEIYITMPVVESLLLNGSGRIKGQNALTAADLQVTLNGSGKIELNASADQVITRLIGSGEIVLSGAAARHSVNISGSGRTETFGMQANNVTVNLSGSGVAEVNAVSALAVEISGSGNVYYKGNPTVTTTVTGSGKVVKK
ncbi:head GIN domain-containing protein [Pontibacter cellulosilyticus]|uniref:DUF2807 domain-containing protein n=1 Tax=Pontibacter cellulosilyticus TaxID=1720253 RepID=A0A923N656_9BACT|nr:head GIN domain-containing protein [Pontibacter cellulosilyticus]MBC5992457.1 DUF2807 domain-containing protein [Pontibacter cellulosilyticus]